MYARVATIKYMINCIFENGNQASLRHITVGCLVLRGDQVLLVKRAEGLIAAGKWGQLGGFMDRGETIEQAAVRETKEESGWDVTNLRLFRINDDPDRPNEDRQNVEFVFLADAVAKTGEPDWESAEVRWFSLDALPAKEDVAFDHHENLLYYKEWYGRPFTLPIFGKK